MKRIYLLFFLFISHFSFAQQVDLNTLSLQEYLAYVKQFHPIVKQTNLVINQSEANLMKSRGAFDPQLEVDYSRKRFKGSEYYNKLNATFKIPVWYGVDLKANYEDNSGAYLNPESVLPNEGLYSVGVSISLAEGFLMNERMTMLKQAKLFEEQAKADQKLLINQILFNASKAYFNWLKAYNEKEIYTNFLANATLRFNGVKKGFEVGENAAIDTLEAGIIVNTRKLNLEQAKIKYTKATLKLSNFLWLQNDVPVELQDNVKPDLDTRKVIDEVLAINTIIEDSLNTENHPKLVSLDRKLQGLDLDRRLKASRLLPQIDFQYNLITQTPTLINSLSDNNYKGGIKVKFPLFLRKQRGELKLSKLKTQELNYEIAATKQSLNNKVKGIVREITSLEQQNKFVNQIVVDYQKLLTAEERKFYLGESSIFLVNNRESKLIDSKLKALQVLNEFLNSKANLVSTLALL